MYNRYRKRDKSEIDRKSEIGLGRVENYNSADISENVIHHVRDYLYTPLFLDITADLDESWGVVKFYESGHTMFITSVCQIKDSERVVYDTLCGSLIYDKPTGTDDMEECPIGFKLLGNREASKIFIHSELTVDIVSEPVNGKTSLVTYVGIKPGTFLYPYKNHGIRAIGTNLHDYTLGAVDYTDEINPWITGKTILRHWSFKIFDEIKKDLFAVPLYDLSTNTYYYASEGTNEQLVGRYDAATINDVPFCGVYGFNVNGKDARHITVTAKHSGPTEDDAGKHDWKVLTSYPYLKYLAANKIYRTNNSLSPTNDLADKGGLCYLSDFNDAATEMNEFMDSLGYWVKDEDGKYIKDEDLTVSSVITVGILRRFLSLLNLNIIINNINIINNKLLQLTII